MQQLKDLKNLQNNSFPIFIFFILTRLIAIFFAFPSVSDIDEYFAKFLYLESGLLPYLDFAFEYPPLALVPIYYAKAIFPATSFLEYAAAFATLLFIVDYLCLEICRFYCKNRLKMNEAKIAYMTLLYSLFGLLLFKILYQRTDLIVALFFALSLLLFHAKDSRLRLSFTTNAFLGFFYKIIPTLNFPAAIILKNRNISGILRNSVIFFLSLACGVYFIEIITNHNFINNMLFHQERAIQVESSLSSFLLFLNMITGKLSFIEPSYGSYQIRTSHLVETIAKFFGHFVLLSFYIALFFKFKKKQIISEQNFLDVTLITILLFLSFQRVLSPQFFIWLIPIAAIWLTQNFSRKLMLIFLFLFFSTWAIFSIDYYALINQEPILVTTLFLRNLVLIGLTIFLVWKFFKYQK